MISATNLNSDFIKPYLAHWQKMPEPARKQMTVLNRNYALGLGERPESTLEEVGSKTSVINRTNILSRLILEAVAQPTQDENQPEGARIMEFRVVTWFDMPSDVYEKEMSEEKENDSTHVIAVVSSATWASLESNSDIFRIISKKMKVKLSGYVVAYQNCLDHPGYTEVILRMNKHDQPRITKAIDNQEVYELLLIPEPNLVDGAVLGIYQAVKVQPACHQTVELVDREYEEIDGKLAEMVAEYQGEPPAKRAAMEQEDEGEKPKYLRALKKNVDRTLDRVMSHINPPAPMFFNIGDPPHIMKELDVQQAEFANLISEGQPIVIGHAAPGSGKSTMAAATTALLYHRDPDAKFLLLAPTNAAANVLAKKTITAMKRCSPQGELPEDSVIRYVSQSYPASGLGPELLANSNFREDFTEQGVSNGYRADPDQVKMMRHRIVITTVDMAILNILNSKYAFDLETGESVFRQVLIDEAAALTLPRLVLVASLAAQGQLVLCGDIHQLPPYITSAKLRSVAGDESGMEFLQRLCERRGEAVVKLIRNYRSTMGIMAASSRVLYDSQLQAPNHAELLEALEDDIKKAPNGFNNLFPRTKDRQLEGDYPKVTAEGAIPGVSFLTVEGTMRVRELSYYNVAELAHIQYVVETLTSGGIKEANIGVDCTYAAQADFCSKMLENYPGIKIGCSNSWQGNERDYMIISLTRSNSNVTPYAASTSQGFLEDLRRLNVSLTRARRGMIIIGNPINFLQNQLVRELLQEVCRLGGFVSRLDNEDAPHSNMALRELVHLTVCNNPFAQGQHNPATPDWDILAANPKLLLPTVHLPTHVEGSKLDQIPDVSFASFTLTTAGDGTLVVDTYCMHS